MSEARDSPASFILLVEIRKSYTLNEINELKNNSFIPLNDVRYPSKELKDGIITEEYRNSLRSFTNLITSNMEDFSYSPLNLYASYDTLSWGSDDLALSNRWNNVLGLDRNKRQKNFKELYPLDYYFNENGSLQMYQGMFYRNDYSPSALATKMLTERYSDIFPSISIPTKVSNPCFLGLISGLMKKTTFPKRRFPSNRIQYLSFSIHYISKESGVIPTEQIEQPTELSTTRMAQVKRLIS